MSAESELEQRIAALDPVQFERLVYDLVLDEHPDAVKLAPPEQGVDMLVLATADQPARVWQAKRFTAGIHWGQCERSLSDAIAAYQPQSVTFVFARDLTGPQLKAFESRLRSVGADKGVTVDHWGLSALRGRLQLNAHVRIRYFRYDEQTMFDILASRLAGANPVQQAFGLEESFGAEDPGFEFDVELFRRAVPEPALVNGASVTMMLRNGPKTLRVAARARDADVGPVLVWNFSDDEAGNAARDQALLATARGDREVVVDSGFVLQLHHAPKLLRATFDQTPREELLSRFVFEPGPGIPLTISAYAASGESVSREVTMYPFPPAPWYPFGEHDRAFVGLDGAFMPYLAIRFEDTDGSRGQVAFLPGLHLEASARENVAALRFWRGLLDSDHVGFSGSLFPAEMNQLGPGHLATPDVSRRKLGFLELLYQAVVWLEERLGVQLSVHGPPLSEEELRGLETALAVLHDGRVDISVGGALQVETDRARAQAETQRIRDRPPFVLTVKETVFGTEVQLGQAVGRLPDVKVIEMPRQTGRYPSVTLRILVVGDPDVACRLLGPNEQPPPDAISI